MKEVSVGNKSKAEVLATCLQQMKACFLDVRWNSQNISSMTVWLGGHVIVVFSSRNCDYCS
jgi:hypothetical protein